MITGIQVSSLRPLLKTPQQVSEAFAKMAQMGCTTVQLQWIDFSVSPKQIADALAASGLRSVSTQDFYTVVMENLDYFIELNRLCASQWLCVSRIPEQYRSAQGLVQFAAQLDALDDRLHASGLRLCFHPTAPDYALTDGLCPVHVLMTRTRRPLQLCLDLYHVHKAGLSMADWIEQYAGRICMVHFKDYRRMPDGTQALVPAGQGEINWAPAVAACLKTGVPYGFVEQETWSRDPFDCLREAQSWLNDACRTALSQA